MKINKKISLVIVIIGIALMAVGLIMNNNKSSGNNNKTDHRSEFTITNSNYLERNYEKYVAFKKTRNDLTDDRIITFVNLGLDKEDYKDSYKANTSDGILMYVNKHYELDKDYVPKTVKVGPLNALLEEETAKSFNKMAEAAKSSGVNLFPVRGYTSYDEQKAIFAIAADENNEEYALANYAKAGFSEYQTGLAVSISGTDNNFRYTFEYSWLSNHAHEYGFILRYPETKEHITGFKFEPWHFRYVGVEVSKFIYENNITFDEYYSKYVMK